MTDTAATERRELERCPFCGATRVENWKSRPPDRAYDVWCVFCHACLCEGPEALDEVTSARLWNTRVNSHAALEAERDALAQHLRAVASMLKETAFSYHVEADHKPAFAVCANVFCSQACYTWDKLNEKPALGETK